MKKILQINKLIGPGLGLCALVVYLATLSSGAYPGQSAALVVENMGLVPRMSPDHPVWHFVVKIVTSLPFRSPVFLFNLFSVLCGSISVWLFYEIVTSAILGVINVDQSNRVRVQVASRLAGVSSAVFLMFCVPFWVVSNRTHVASFDMLLLLLATRFLVAYAKSARVSFAYAFALLYGLGIVELPTFIMLAPLSFLLFSFVMWRNDDLRIRPIAGVIAAGVAGLLFYFVAAWQFFGTEGYELRNYSSYGKVLWIILRDQYLLIARSLPRDRWLIILVETVVPWLTCLIVAHRALNDEEDKSYYFLHAVITGVVVCLLLDFSFAPWQMLGMRRLLVTPYLLASSVFGYIVAYWYLLPANWWIDDEETWKIWIRKKLGTVIIVPLFVLLLVMPFLNFNKARGASAAFVNQYARKVVESMPGKQWLVTDGALDNHFLLAAHEMGRSLNVFNIRSGVNDVYMRRVSRLFEEPEMKRLAMMGMWPLLREWFYSEDVDENVAILVAPDLWIGSGHTILPNKLVFLGVDDKREIDADQLMSEHKEFWSKELPCLIEKAEKESGDLANIGRLVAQHSSMVANNLGVLMEDLGRNDDAFDSYTKAREIYTNNISALLNQGVMLQRGFAVEEKEAIEKAIENATSSLDVKSHAWVLSYYYGYVRAPEVFAELGLNWALSGHPGLAASSVSKAIDLLPDSKKHGAKQHLADFYLLYDQNDKSELIYTQLLAEHPEDNNTLLGLARIALKNGDFVRAKEMLERAESGGAAKTKIAVEFALLYGVMGDSVRARIVLEEVIELNPDFVQAWRLLAELLLGQNDIDGVQKCLYELKELERGSGYNVYLIEARLALMQKDFAKARRFFREASMLKPGNVRIMEILVRLELMRGRMKDALKLGKEILAIDSGNALGNYIVGSFLQTEGEDDLAELSYRKSLERKKLPEAMNDLAGLLSGKGEYAEAEELVRAAVKINSQMYHSWDTLGVILMKKGQLKEAGEAFDKSLSLFKGNMSVLLNVAELKIKTGARNEALELLNIVDKKSSELSVREKSKSISLRNKIKTK